MKKWESGVFKILKMSNCDDENVGNNFCCNDEENDGKIEVVGCGSDSRRASISYWQKCCDGSVEMCVH